MTLSIRPARPGDAALVTAFVRELAEYEKLTHECETTEAMIEEALFSQNPRVFCDIVVWNGEPIGNAIWYLTFSTFTGRTGLYLEDLFVRPALRSHGIGRALLREHARIARARDCGRMEWAVLDWNEPALKFYKSLGARPMNEWIVHRLTATEIAKLAEET
jgi:GNAT superfamily N-acetyltransferase